MAKAKEIEGLDCGAGASEGMRLVLASRFEEMCAYRVAALDWSDPEGVHDMRVASRRLRSALKDFSIYLRGRRLRRAAARLKDLAGALGEVRDRDVAIAALGKLAAEAPAGLSAGVEEFAIERVGEREKARVRLAEALADESLDELKEEFGRALEGPRRKSKTDARKENEESLRSFRMAGREVIMGRLRELSGMGASLYRPLKAGPLHRMRISAKGLRYAVELFAPCWERPLVPFAKEIAGLQTSLGELHDCDEWIREVGAALKEQEGAPTGKRTAAIWLLDHFMQERTRHFSDALLRWHAWETGGFHLQLAAALDEK